ncbi:MAG: tRNA uracil 4-sulfurtransferase ThiI [Candidatus Micrarchaeia archaeon]
MYFDFIEIHYGEIWLRGKNRPVFINALSSNITRKLSTEAYAGLVNAGDRLLVKLDARSDISSMLSKLSFVFGISWYAPAVLSRNRLAEMMKKADALARASGIGALKIVAHRSIKSTRFDSNAIVGMFLKNSGKLSFLPDKYANDKLYINVTKVGTLMHINKVKGLGGLPVGVSGKAVILLSGGIDSPVAAYMAMKRGMEPIYVHMHAFQSGDEAKASKIGKLVGLLSRYSAPSKIYYVPSHVFQSHMLKKGRRYGRYETVVFKRFLLEMAERIALKEGAKALVTGESIGQVSSQTIENMSASSKGIGAFVLRPLIAMDKEEIIDTAKRIGTFETSIIKYKDVCSISARNPKTKATSELIDRIFSSAGLEEALELSLSKASVAQASQ